MKKKSTLPKTEPNFPWKKVRVIWQDITGYSSHHTIKEMNELRAHTMITEGWLYSQDEHSIKTFGGYSYEDGEYCFSDVNVFPKNYCKIINI